MGPEIFLETMWRRAMPLLTQAGRATASAAAAAAATTAAKLAVETAIGVKEEEDVAASTSAAALVLVVVPVVVLCLAPLALWQRWSVSWTASHLPFGGSSHAPACATNTPHGQKCLWATLTSLLPTARAWRGGAHKGPTRRALPGPAAAAAAAAVTPPRVVVPPPLAAGGSCRRGKRVSASVKEGP